jgi:3-oxoacyl-[acyl-carrier protein] reductase
MGTWDDHDQENKMNELDFTGRQVLVVGGSSGIGNGIARSFLDRGAKVQVWGTRPSGEDYSAEEGSDLQGLGYSCVDVSDRDVIAAHVPQFDKLDVLVQCQGTVIYGRGEFERQGWDRVMAVNLDSLMEIAMKFRPMLLAGGSGSMIIVSSVSGVNQTSIGNPAYGASKAGAINLTKVLGKAWAAEGIRVNGIAPGLVETKLTRVTTGNPKRLAAALSQIPDGRQGTPKDIGNAALFLASPLAGYVTGQTLVVDGGLTLT